MPRLNGRRVLTGLAGIAIITGGLAGSVGRVPAAAQNGCVTESGPVGPAFKDCAGGQALNIVPPGETGLYNSLDFANFEATGARPAHTDDQESMYGDLVKVAPNLTPANLGSYYKDASFHPVALPGDRVETFPLHPGVVIIRDAQFGVPHIYGATRYDVEWGSGYASAEDRLFMMDVLRHYGRGQLSSFLGPSPADLAMDCSIDAVAGYTEAELQHQIDVLPQELPNPITIGGVTTSEGQQIINDGTAFTDGVNGYIDAALLDPTKLPVEYPALQVVPARWKTTDIVATATLVQAIFAVGGGNEVQSALLYQSLVQRYGAAKGGAMWSDFRSQNDPEAITSLSASFPYEQVPASVDPNSIAMPTAPYTSTACNGGPIPPIPPAGLGQVVVGPVTVDLSALVPSNLPHASNELIVNANHSATGHPIAVFGPQTGYFAPEILHEVDLHGPGINARGVSFPGTEIYVELGRGADYSWSATSAGADIIDQRAERLCNTDGSPATTASTAYVYRGVCTPMYERTDSQVAKPNASTGAVPPAIVTYQVERTVHGPVLGRTTAIDPSTGNPVPVAISVERSTWFDELGAAAAFLDWNDPDLIHGVHDWQSFAGKETGTFNWTYVDSKDVGYYMSGRLPIRNGSVNPNFPVWGTGQWDWQGFEPTNLSAADPHPRAVNPPAGFFANWNNKPAPGFSASDAQFAYGPVYRQQSLADRIKAVINTRPATPTDIVNAMEDGGTVDLDGSQLVNQLATALNGATLTAQQAEALGILQNWVLDPAWAGSVPGAHRRDRSGGGAYENGDAVAIMDALYPRLAHAVFDPWLDSSQFGLLQGIMGLNNPPGPVGSAYDGGWEGYLQRSLRQAANPLIANPYSQSYCGGGVLATCQAALISALQGALDQLTAAYGTSDPTAWTCARSNTAGQCNPANDDIQFRAVGVGTVPNMPWVNRPTFQQVASYPAHR